MNILKNSLKKLCFSSLVVLTSLAITGCTPTVDASSAASFKYSTTQIADELEKEQKVEFGKVLMFYTLGKRPDKMLSYGFAGPSEDIVLQNVKVIDGLSYEEIMELYKNDYAEFEFLLKQEKEQKKFKEEVETLLEKKRFDNIYKKFSAADQKILTLIFLNELKKTVDDAKKVFDENQKYLKNVLVYDFIADRLNTYSNDNPPAVRFAIKNLGIKTIKKLVLCVYYKDEKGNVIYEKEYTPISSSYNSDMEELKPGYVYEIAARKYYTLDNKLEMWAPTKTTLKIVDIELDDIVNTVADSTIGTDEVGNGNTEILAKTKYVIKLEEYVDLVKILNFKAERIDTWGAKNVPAFRMDVQNNGNLPLKEVEVTVYFKNKKGEIIHEMKEKPVARAIYESKLLPCKTERMEANAYTIVKYELKDWDPKQTEYKITNLEFDRKNEYSKPDIKNVCTKSE